jgi:hypothetical protein
MIEIIITTLSILVVVLGYTTFNLLSKNEKAEDIIYSYKKYMTQVSEAIEQSQKKLKEIDSKGSFKSDDEVGWFFEKVQLIQDILNQYQLHNF